MITNATFSPKQLKKEPVNIPEEPVVVDISELEPVEEKPISETVPVMEPRNNNKKQKNYGNYFSKKEEQKGK